MAPDHQAYMQQIQEAGERYLRTILSRPMEGWQRAEFADGILQLNNKAKLALNSARPVAVPAHLDGAES